MMTDEKLPGEEGEFGEDIRRRTLELKRRIAQSRPPNGSRIDIDVGGIKPAAKVPLPGDKGMTRAQMMRAYKALTGQPLPKQLISKPSKRPIRRLK